LQQRYPVLYLLDGDAHFLSATGVVQFMGSGPNGNSQIPELIVVAMPNTNRTRDLTPTHSTFGFLGKEEAWVKASGGGDRFLRFIRDELFPKIDSTYRTLPYRILVGHSFGGLLALHALLEAPGMFQAYVAIDPGFWWDDQELVRRVESRLKAASQLRASVFVTIADTPFFPVKDVRTGADVFARMRTSAEAFAQSLRAGSPAGLRWSIRHFEADDHVSAPLPSLYQGLLFIFEGFRPPATEDMFSRPDALVAHFRRVSERLGVPLLPPEVWVDQRAHLLLQMEKVDTAIEFFKLNVSNYPGSYRVHSSLGAAYEAKGDKSLAIECYQRAVALNPKNQNAMRRLRALQGEDPKKR
jgi:hypothetical protein